MGLTRAVMAALDLSACGTPECVINEVWAEYRAYLFGALAALLVVSLATGLVKRALGRMLGVTADFGGDDRPRTARRIGGGNSTEGRRYTMWSDGRHTWDEDRSDKDPAIW